MTATAVVVIYIVTTVVLFLILWALLGGFRSDVELHHAADLERRRRQRDRWTSPDGRTVR